MTKDKALELALEALECANSPNGDYENEITVIKEALAQEHEQDGECKYCTDGCFACDARKLPAQRTWVGLTNEEIAEFDTWHDNREEEVGWCNPSEIVAYIETKLKDKNL